MMDKLREEFESWYRGLMGTPESVLKNLRSGDSYSETDGERLNIAWLAYQAASQATNPVVLPPLVQTSNAPYGAHGFNAAIYEVKKALDAANVKWKVLG